MSNISNQGNTVTHDAEERQSNAVRVLDSTRLVVVRLAAMEEIETGKRPTLAEIIDRAVTLYAESRKAATNA